MWISRMKFFYRGLASGIAGAIRFSRMMWRNPFVGAMFGLPPSLLMGILNGTVNGMTRSSEQKHQKEELLRKIQALQDGPPADFDFFKNQVIQTYEAEKEKIKVPYLSLEMRKSSNSSLKIISNLKAGEQKASGLLGYIEDDWNNGKKLYQVIERTVFLEEEKEKKRAAFASGILNRKDMALPLRRPDPENPTCLGEPFLLHKIYGFAGIISKKNAEKHNTNEDREKRELKNPDKELGGNKHDFSETPFARIATKT